MITSYANITVNRACRVGIEVETVPEADWICLVLETIEARLECVPVFALLHSSIALIYTDCFAVRFSLAMKKLYSLHSSMMLRMYLFVSLPVLLTE